MALHVPPLHESREHIPVLDRDVPQLGDAVGEAGPNRNPRQPARIRHYPRPRHGAHRASGQVIRDTRERHHQSRTIAASQLVSYRQFRYRLKRLRID